MKRAEPAGRAIADRDVLLWCNAQAGGAPDPEDLAIRLRACGRSVRLAEPGRDAPPDPLTELVLVAGGDGTVAQAARRLGHSGVPLAILPSGTANNVAAALGIADTDKPEQAVSGRAHAIDLGRVQGPWGERIFVESVGVGLLALTERSLHETAERQGGYEAAGKIVAGRRAIETALARPEAFDGSVRSDGDVPLERSLVFVEICNLGRTGPGVLLAPEADASDGAFDVVLGDLAAAEALRHACEIGGSPVRLVPDLPVRRCRRIELTCRLGDLRIDGKFGTEIADADPCDDRHHDVTVETLPGALWVITPNALRPGDGDDAERS
ncbi:diacylglycerol kinase family protein [uncultured Jannaschia sp.]|uniref:diacylglycerol/lipid kinase family protein n=1 Tax=uncultured Jannaschia sp. TaxID=293347 RepID=UPI002628160D|nr:diacylglycerol kinase family protein [uncultured Jannaschia sp.]